MFCQQNYSLTCGARVGLSSCISLFSPILQSHPIFFFINLNCNSSSPQTCQHYKQKVQKRNEQPLASASLRYEARKLIRGSSEGELYAKIQVVQSTTFNPFICLNSLVLFVTRVAPRLCAWAPISVSIEPMGFPAFSRLALTSP